MLKHLENAFLANIRATCPTRSAIVIAFLTVRGHGLAYLHGRISVRGRMWTCAHSVAKAAIISAVPGTNRTHWFVKMRNETFIRAARLLR